MTEEKMQKRFPSYFSNFVMPEAAKEQEIVVYRACRTRAIDEGSFLPTYVQNGFCVCAGGKTDDPQQYSLSTAAKIKDIRRFVISTSAYQPPFVLAKGTTAPLCGKSCYTNEYKNETRQQRKSSHVDWWLYENANPWDYFREVSYDDEVAILSGE